MKNELANWIVQKRLGRFIPVVKEKDNKPAIKDRKMPIKDRMMRESNINKK